MTTTLTGKNQVTVPAEITQKLGLTPGTLFDWKLTDDPKQIIIRIRPSRRELLTRLEEIARGSQHKSGASPVDDLIRERAEDDSSR
jgi:AbrB family looped-hinge helix DNA binding protein